MKSFQPLAEEIDALKSSYRELSDSDLKAKTAEFKLRLENGESLDDLLLDAFAAVREAARRTVSLEHFDVQLMAGIAFHRGMVAEQKTGEGKTLSATTALYLNALTGRGAHLVTVNDYLAHAGLRLDGADLSFAGNDGRSNLCLDRAISRPNLRSEYKRSRNQR